MATKLLHIGLPKCGSTFLQKIIYPEIEKETNIKHYKKKDFINGMEKQIFNLLENENKLENDLPDSFILSDESLYSKKLEFDNISETFELIKKNFSDDTIILIVIRNPYEFLNSIYIQKIQTMNIVKPENFFYVEKNNAIRKKGKYNLHEFDYNYLISLYKSYFKKVIIVKHESLHDLSFLNEIFKLNDSFIKKLEQKKNQIYKKSISKQSIEIIFFLNRFINLNKLEFFLKKLSRKNSKNLFEKIINRVFKFIRPKYFFRHVIDENFITYKKYYINKSFIPIDIDQMIRNYNKLKF
tara:strand:- start:85 stop:975 length:891 start_codon:yes stop_codon:yes gene_type:complete